MTDLEMDLILAKAEIATLKAEKAELEKAVAGNMFTVPDDWVKVVRCKDCKYWSLSQTWTVFGNRPLGDCTQHEGEYWHEDDFCSCGERKDGASNG